jgi:hypothetical protein
MTYSVNHNHHVTVLTDWVNSPGWISNLSQFKPAWRGLNIQQSDLHRGLNLTQPGQPNPCGQPRPTSRYHSCHFDEPRCMPGYYSPELAETYGCYCVPSATRPSESFGCWAPGTPSVLGDILPDRRLCTHCCALHLVDPKDLPVTGYDKF